MVSDGDVYDAFKIARAHLETLKVSEVKKGTNTALSEYMLSAMKAGKFTVESRKDKETIDIMISFKL
jgi:porphobilinogen deaminase